MSVTTITDINTKVVVNKNELQQYKHHATSSIKKLVSKLNEEKHKSVTAIADKEALLLIIEQNKRNKPSISDAKFGNGLKELLELTEQAMLEVTEEVKKEQLEKSKEKYKYLLN